MEYTRTWDLPAAAILLSLMLTAVGRLGVTKWVPGLERVQTLAVVAVLLGLTLGQSTFRREVVWLLSLGYSLVVIPLELARFLEAQIDLETRLLSVGGRLLYSLGEFGAGRPVEDPLFFLTLLSLLFWTIGLTSGYFLLRKGDYLVAVLPAGLVMLVIQAYDFYPPGRVWFIAFFVFLAFLLLGRMNYLHNQQEWRRRNVFLVPETGLDLASGSAVIAAVIVLVAWTLPGVASSPAATRLWERLTEPWRQMREQLSDAVAAVETGIGSGSEFFGENLDLGTGSPLGQQVMFRVYTPEDGRVAPRYYWRGRVYDYYENHQWQSQAAPFQAFDPRTDMLYVPDASGRIVQDFTFTVYRRQRTLYLPSQPLWTDRLANVRLLPLPGGIAEAVYLRTSVSMQPGEVYQARAALIAPTIAELRAAGEDYPEWVRQRYLQLPENFSPRIQALALEITATAQTPYDKADAITAYLRRQIRYTPTIPAPPRGRDPLEYVLFDLKSGFCNYTASAEVLMLRSLGVPARLAVGFAEGNADLRGRSFTVLERDAHAWPEVYFPGVGWVEFEPTGNQEAIQRPSGIEVDERETGLPRPFRRLLGEEDDLNPSGRRPEPERAEALPGDDSSPDFRLILLRSILPALALILLFVFWHANRRYALFERIPTHLIETLERRQTPVPLWLKNWDLYNRAGPLGRSFEVINLSLRWLGEPPPVHATPAQRARVLAELAPAAAEDIQTLAAEYQAGLYSLRPADLRLARRAVWKIFPQVLRARILRTLAFIQERL